MHEKVGELDAGEPVELSPSLMESVKLVERHVRILEHVRDVASSANTMLERLDLQATSCEENQKYLVSFRNSLIIATCGKCATLLTPI